MIVWISDQVDQLLDVAICNKHGVEKDMPAVSTVLAALSLNPESADLQGDQDTVSLIADKLELELEVFSPLVGQPQESKASIVFLEGNSNIF